MLKRYSILFGISIALVLLFIATLYYPGGSQHQSNSVGYDWRNNYMSNLFGPKAVNGASNPSQPWAIAGMLFLSISFALFFIQFSKKIPQKSAANVIKYFGAGAMVFAFLAVTPYHDDMITIASTLSLVSMFYITVFVFKSKLHVFKILCVVCLLVSYGCNYVYYTRNYLEFLPIMQKLSLAIDIIWMMSLQYFTAIHDFQPEKDMGVLKGGE